MPGDIFFPTKSISGEKCVCFGGSGAAAKRGSMVSISPVSNHPVLGDVPARGGRDGGSCGVLYAFI